MKLELKRIAKKNDYTISKLYIDGAYFCDAIEDKDRGLNSSMTEAEVTKAKIYGETAIPTGTYLISMNTVSPKFKNSSWAKEFGGIVPRLLNVKGFSGVLIHPGNTAKDSLGCILVGLNKLVGKVINSLYTWRNLMRKLMLDKNNITLVIS